MTTSVATTASAPGKLVLAGEYAVAFGGRAVVTAIDRRAVARFDAAARAGAGALPLLDALAAALVPIDRAAAARVAAIVVDTSAFRDGDRKLGLGSSAAATVAAAALALPDAPADLIDRLARHVHAAVQARRGAAGSGVDIAAAVFGGTTLFQAGAGVPFTLPPAARWVAYDLGQPADTPSLLATVTAARVAAPSTIAPILAALDASAAELAVATTAGHAIAAIAAGGAAVAALANAIAVDLATATGRVVQALATSLGGAAKTCGAGAGDVGIAILPDDAAAAAFRAGLGAHSVAALDLRLGQPGIVVHRAA